jgi:Ion channel
MVGLEGRSTLQRKPWTEPWSGPSGPRSPPRRRRLYLAAQEFRDEPFFAQPGPHQKSEYPYFSFVALTTLGFGDLSPSVGLPQALTVLEALAGQIFLVTLVARLVTLWVRQSEAAG